MTFFQRYLIETQHAVAQKSPCACNLQHRPPLTQLIKLSLSLFKGSALHAESLAMLSKALPFLRSLLRWDLTHHLE